MILNHIVEYMGSDCLIDRFNLEWVQYMLAELRIPILHWVQLLKKEDNNILPVARRMNFMIWRSTSFLYF